MAESRITPLLAPAERKVGYYYAFIPMMKTMSPIKKRPVSIR